MRENQNHQIPNTIVKIPTSLQRFRPRKKMASHHHFWHPPTTTSASCYGHCCPAPYTPCCLQPPPPQDPHVHHPAAPSQFPHSPQLHLCSDQSHLSNLPQYHPQIQECYFQEERRTHPTVSSLLRRIASLEAALRHRSSHFSSSHSLRDAAARTIQTHFRAFLLRRSRTLRQLKDLASIKSTLSILKSSVAKKTLFDYDVVYHKAMNLLLKLDSIQGCDPMIRDGRRSLSLELNQFLDFIDAVCVERSGLSSKVRYGGNNVKARVLSSERKNGNAKYGGLKGIYAEKLRGLFEKIDKLAEELDEEESEAIESHNAFVTNKDNASGSRSGSLMKQHKGVQSRGKKSVSFAENGKVYRVLRRNHEQLLDEDCDDSIDRGNIDDVEREHEDGLCREVEVIGVSSKEAEDDEEETHSENGGSLPSSDGEKDPKSKSNSERKRFDEVETENFVFSAPLPVKMETRADLIGKRRK